MIKNIIRRQISNTFNNNKRKLILGLETSADDTCASIVSSNREILSNVVLKQNKIHEQYGGIHPLYAVQGHMMNLPIAVSKSMEDAKVKIEDLDAIATTQGPGMIGCLQVGIMGAKSISSILRKPLIGIHHMQAHALTCLLTEINPPAFPFFTLLCSGGHTMIVDVEDVNKMSILASTLDDSIGNAFDQIAKSLNIPWSLHPSNSPGGALENFADQFHNDINHDEDFNNFKKILKVPLPGQLQFSYSGLRSAFQRLLNEVDKNDKKKLRSLSRAFQYIAVKQLEDKLSLAFRNNSRSRRSSLIVSGGVASNTYLRNQLKTLTDKYNMDVYFPHPSLCTGKYFFKKI